MVLGEPKGMWEPREAPNPDWEIWEGSLEEAVLL